MSTAFDVERFAALAHELALGRPLTHAAVTGSTNDDALAAARAGAPHGALFVADEQLRGRGRRGNVWHAAPTEALLFSVLLRPKLAAERAASLALLTGLAVRAVVSECISASGNDLHVEVKWPNDVLVGRKKIGGVLVESQLRGNVLGAVVVGVGLNVGRMDLPPDVAVHATSLRDDLGATISREELLAKLLGEIDLRLGALESSRAPLAALSDELSRYDALRGRCVSVGDLRGIASGVDAEGNLELCDEAGRIHKVASGHVTVEHS
jgi:BirA family biotin operon repressor/biotin-[acetyl-CoA-carboxylase] ligase